MSILVFAESQNNKFKKSTFEAISYAKDLATLLDLECIVTCPAETENLEESLCLESLLQESLNFHPRCAMKR